VTGQKVTLIGVNTTSFRVMFFLFDCCQWPSTFCALAMKTYSISAARNAWVGDLVCVLWRTRVTLNDGWWRE
jgi:hypothetical protein